MANNRKPNNWANSWAYRRAKGAVTSLIDSPKRLLALLEQVSRKSEKQASGPIAKTLESVKVMVRLVSAYAKGEYRAIALDNLAMIVAALLYFVMPLDALPDFIAVFGLTDDMAILAWTWSVISEEVERFLAWELARSTKLNDGDVVKDVIKEDGQPAIDKNPTS